ncbi:TapY2 family type IVa secretion system protein [Shewanella waksmanii]|uniref:TapY2 family type IVa secretion system protein n=1 Tax=Shewanella waksmanii TaxID=213783 RepID=UPI003735C21C
MRVWLILLLALSSAVAPVKAEQKAEYKCFVNSRLGEQIVFYRWKVAEYQLKVKSLPGRSNVSSRGDKFLITDVVECKLESEDFDNASAKKLDAITLR